MLSTETWLVRTHSQSGEEDSAGAKVSVFAAGAFIADSSMPMPWQHPAQWSVVQLSAAQGNAASTGSAQSSMTSTIATDLAKNFTPTDCTVKCHAEKHKDQDVAAASVVDGMETVAG
jgi:hypothetical protein